MSNFDLERWWAMRTGFEKGIVVGGCCLFIIIIFLFLTVIYSFFSILSWDGIDQDPATMDDGSVPWEHALIKVNTMLDLNEISHAYLPSTSGKIIPP